MTRIHMTREWCLAIAQQEGTCEVGAGWLARDPSVAVVADVVPIDRGRLAFGRFVSLMRRQRHLSIEQLAEQAALDMADVISIEEDIRYQPEPRTVYRLAQLFGLPQQRLMELAGLAVAQDSSVREEAIRFAARSEPIQQLTQEERNALESFVRALGGKLK